MVRQQIVRVVSTVGRLCQNDVDNMLFEPQLSPSPGVRVSHLTTDCPLARKHGRSFEEQKALKNNVDVAGTMTMHDMNSMINARSLRVTTPNMPSMYPGYKMDHNRPSRRYSLSQARVLNTE